MNIGAIMLFVGSSVGESGTNPLFERCERIRATRVCSEPFIAIKCETFQILRLTHASSPNELETEETFLIVPHHKGEAYSDRKLTGSLI
jgi:hypothetical protein